MRISLCRLLFLLLAFSSTSVRAALTADNLLLITNKNVPDSRKLADHYAEARHVPAGRVVELDLPTGDDIPVDVYDEKMVAAIRDFILSNHLEKQIGCLVTFYGVPLRIPNRPNTSELKEEIAAIRRQLNATQKQAVPMVESIERLATETDPSFTPAQVSGMDQ